MSDIDPSSCFSLGEAVLHGVNIIGWVFDKGGSDTVAMYCPKNTTSPSLAVDDVADGLNEAFYVFLLPKAQITVLPQIEII